MKLYHQLCETVGFTITLHIGMPKAMAYNKQVNVAYRFHTVANYAYSTCRTLYKHYFEFVMPMYRKIEIIF